MELVTDESGDVAPRLGDVSMTAEQALEDHAVVMHYVVLMLCAGIVHGDLSEFNVLVDDYGPVIIDLPQAVDASANNHAESMLQRDIENMTHYYGQFAPELLSTQYAEEIWALYQDGALKPGIQLSGQFTAETTESDVDGVLQEIKAVLLEEEKRQERLVSNEESGE